MTAETDAILDAAGVNHQAMSPATKAGLAKVLADRAAKRSRAQQQYLAELEHSPPPTAAKRGLCWRLSLVHADGRRIELGVGEFATRHAAHKHLVEFKRRRVSLEHYIPDVQGPLS